MYGILPDKGGIFILKNRKAFLIALCILVLCIVAAFLAYYILVPESAESSKTITITINHLQGNNRTLKITTDAEYLGAALEKKGLIKGNKGQSGFIVYSVDGESADENEKQWWGFTKSDEYVDTDIDKTPITDGDSFEFSLHAG